MRSAFFLCLLLAASISFSQKNPIQGVFHYKASISYPDTNLVFKEWNVTVFTNDTVVRVETETGQFGNQVYIRHISMNKAYLLLNIDGRKYAIQTDLSKEQQKDTSGVKYSFKRKLGSKKIAGFKCKKYYIEDKAQKESFYGYFAKNVSNKYLEVYREIPGLAMEYVIPTQDGLTKYQLQSFEEGAQNRDLFGIPSDYKRVTFEQFVTEINGE
jgi:hypothetical protein